jgi:hypothetical protein
VAPEPTAVAEANAQQTFVDILDTGVITPLATFQVNESHLGMHLSDNRRPGRKSQIGQERELRGISRYPPRRMLIMLRIESRSSKRNTSRNITLGNMLALTMTFNGSQGIPNNRFCGQQEVSEEPEPTKSKGGSAN